jgi:uncharacterized membrane protein
MKNRLTDWPTTLLGAFILAFLAWCVHLAPSLLERPELLVAIAVGVGGFFLRGRNGAA